MKFTQTTLSAQKLDIFWKKAGVGSIIGAGFDGLSVCFYTDLPVTVENQKGQFRRKTEKGTALNERDPGINVASLSGEL